ncbi:MAG: hypothetical protein JXR80_10195 [Deltaproteobacteria bacterium]|nr:hypothetical protein [Deltaproteobacteria bacterium]
MNVSASPASAVNYYSQTPLRGAASSPQPAASSAEKVQQTPSGSTSAAPPQNNNSTGRPNELSADEERTVTELKKRDAEVKAHESAHMAAGGPYVRGGASYEYEKGPDNQNYAVGGEVSIDVSPENTPEATIRKMQVVKRAALAPKDPSSQDRSVAAQAAQTEARARLELQKERNSESPQAEKQPSAANQTTTQAMAATSPERATRQAATAYRQTAFATNPTAAKTSGSAFRATA